MQNLFHWTRNVNHRKHAQDQQRTQEHLAVTGLHEVWHCDAALRTTNIQTSLLRPSSCLMLAFGVISNCPHVVLTSHQLSLKRNRNISTYHLVKNIVLCFRNINLIFMTMNQNVDLSEVFRTKRHSTRAM